MPHIVALDIGGKRTGVAITDELNIIASGLTTVATNRLIDFLKKLHEEKLFETIVVGKPTHLDGSDTHGTAIAHEVVQKVKQALPTLAIEWIDERFTSKMAFQTMIDSGLTKKQRRNKALVDEVSATLILQTFLERQQL